MDIGKNWHLHLVLLLVAAAVYLGCIVSPPSLMDDVDAVQAQIARNMLTSGDWVTARLDGVVYLEKAPLIYWMIAVAYATLRRARLGGAPSDCSVGNRSLLADGRLRHMGFRQAGRILCGPLHGHVRRPVSFHPDSDSRRHADVHRRAGHVGVPARSG